MYLKSQKAPRWKLVLAIIYLTISTAAYRICLAHYTTLYLFNFEIKILSWAGLLQKWVYIQYKDDMEGLASIENKTGIITVNADKFKNLSEEIKHFVILNLQLRISKDISVYECDQQTMYTCMKIFPEKNIKFWHIETLELLSNTNGSIFGVERFKEIKTFIENYK